MLMAGLGMEGGGSFYGGHVATGHEAEELSRMASIQGGDLVLAALSGDHDREGETACGPDDAIRMTAFGYAGSWYGLRSSMV